MSSSAFAPVRASSVRGQVFDVLRNAIFQGKLQPGDPIREARIATELSVSQNTVREALLELQKLGLVVRNPNRNTLVTKLSDEDIQERVSTRLLLEPTCVQLAAGNMQLQHFKALRELIREMEQARGTEAAELDLKFHRTIWALSGHRVLTEILEQLVLPLFAFVTIVRFRHIDKLTELAHRHKVLLRALESRDESRIGDAVRRHLTDHYQEFFKER
jgi:DNA-binding GntR family transcriptional regulator